MEATKGTLMGIYIYAHSCTICKRDFKYPKNYKKHKCKGKNKLSTV